ncbi:hypothetical protein [Corynebacterium atypicum]|uniref:hypothetical protein n=1 Tax=Corynebacterium atypicum TaxID=191610 RepID=UPI001F2BF92F|nr:hypothetical protein [Corynebacterium atypicum]
MSASPTTTQRSQRLRYTAPPRRNRQTTVPAPTPTVPRPQRHQPGRLGSRQVVSVRGRRVHVERANPRYWRIVTLAFCLLVAGVGLAMYLSGLSTQQTFQLQQLTVQESQLDNRIETLSRDLEDAKSASALAVRAGREHLGVPQQAGVLRTQRDGGVIEERAAELETRPVIDVNDNTGSQKPASSDPDRTKGMAGQLAAVPRSQNPEGTEDYHDRALPAGAAEESEQVAQAQPQMASPAPYPTSAGR